MLSKFVDYAQRTGSIAMHSCRKFAEIFLNHD